MAASTIGTSATAVATTAPGGRVIVQNLGSAPVYLGRDASVTTATGIKIEAGGHIVLDGRRSAVPDLYLVSGTAGQDVRWEVIA